VMKAFSRVGTLLHKAHTEDFERRRRPEAGKHVGSDDEDDDDDEHDHHGHETEHGHDPNSAQRDHDHHGDEHESEHAHETEHEGDSKTGASGSDAGTMSTGEQWRTGHEQGTDADEEAEHRAEMDEIHDALHVAKG
jgi:hypothetical protein